MFSKQSLILQPQFVKKNHSAISVHSKNTARLQQNLYLERWELLKNKQSKGAHSRREKLSRQDLPRKNPENCEKQFPYFEKTDRTSCRLNFFNTGSRLAQWNDRPNEKVPSFARNRPTNSPMKTFSQKVYEVVKKYPKETRLPTKRSRKKQEIPERLER